MKTIKEIFETNEALLNEPEVKELIEQFRIQFNKLKEAKYNYWDEVTNITLNSELFVIDGINCKEAISKIHDLSF